MLLTAANDLVGKQVLNGTGAVLGRVVTVVGDADGVVREIVVRQLDDVKEWVVEAVHIKHVADHVLLKGPREGYHIAPIAPLPASLPAVLEA